MNLIVFLQIQTIASEIEIFIALLFGESDGLIDSEMIDRKTTVIRM
jgi:hypothetical protein